jgi:hypothetical protein
LAHGRQKTSFGSDAAGDGRATVGDREAEEGEADEEDTTWSRAADLTDADHDDDDDEVLPTLFEYETLLGVAGEITLERPGGLV